MKSFFEEAVSQIERAPVLLDPFAHLMIEKVFPASLYADILKHLPDTFYYQSSKFYPERHSLALNEDNLALMQSDLHLFEFWSKFKQEICSERFLSAILKKFNRDVKASFRPVVQLLKDKDHYSIGPHTDISQKVITLLFYLPSSSDQIHLGTSLYRPIDPHFTCSGEGHYSFESFVKVGKALFLPNSLFGFLRTDTSFHGVEPIGAQEKERNLLTYTIWT